MQPDFTARSYGTIGGPVGFSLNAVTCANAADVVIPYDAFSPKIVNYHMPPAVRVCQHCRRQTSATTCEGCGAPA